MARPLYLLLAFTVFPFAASAIEAPPGQTRIDANSVLRGSFVQELQMNATKGPLRSSGHFVVAPARGLIWSIEKPFPTSTIITPNGAAQDFGGFAMNLPIKNLRSLYDMVGGALAGDWNGLEKDFIIKRSGNADHWKMLLTPRQPEKPKLPYAKIAISGSPFVENIVMTKTNGINDTLDFMDEVLSPAELTPTESAVFDKVRPSPN